MDVVPTDVVVVVEVVVLVAADVEVVVEAEVVMGRGSVAVGEASGTPGSRGGGASPPQANSSDTRRTVKPVWV